MAGPIPHSDVRLLKFCENRFAIFLIPAAIARPPKNGSVNKLLIPFNFLSVIPVGMQYAQSKVDPTCYECNRHKKQ